jgi:hypothetical protein
MLKVKERIQKLHQEKAQYGWRETDDCKGLRKYHHNISS